MGHYYCDKYPSVTSILSECIDKSGPMAQVGVNLTTEFVQSYCSHEIEEGYFNVTELELNDARFYYKKVWRQATNYGSIIHRMVRLYLSSGYVYKSNHEECRTAFKAFQKFVADFNPEPIALEYQVYGNHVAGTVDFKGWITIERKRLKYLLDWKSNKAFYGRSHMYQSAKYRQLDGDKDFDGHGVVRLDKYTGEYQFVDGGGNMPRYRDTYEQDLLTFNALAVGYFLRHPKIAKRAGFKLKNMEGLCHLL